jgi:hypothetical protein
MALDCQVNEVTRVFDSANLATNVPESGKQPYAAEET